MNQLKGRENEHLSDIRLNAIQEQIELNSYELLCDKMTLDPFLSDAFLHGSANMSLPGSKRT